MENTAEQRSLEWFAARKGKLTGSNIGAALDTNPWRTSADLIRAMVREYHGAESEFQGNVATEYGTLHEPLATMDYMTKTGNMVDECGFFVSNDLPWLGASPDGIVTTIENERGLIEIKCPFGLRNKKGDELKFKTAEDQPHYYAQMQIEMYCAGYTWCDFYQWTNHGDSLERVNINPQWLSETLPKLHAFYQRYLSELDNPKHLEPLINQITDAPTVALLAEYDRLTSVMENAKAERGEVMAKIIEATGDKNSEINGRKITKVERKGSVQYAKALKAYAPNADLSEYTSKPTSYWRIS